MTVRIHWQRFASIFLLIWLLPALACNFPGPPQKDTNSSAKAFRQTLQAQRTLVTPLVTLPPTPLPKPGEPGVGTSTPTPQPTSQQPASVHPFPGLRTATPGAPPLSLPPMSSPQAGLPPFTYTTQSGDTLLGVARRFGTSPDQITSPDPLPTEGLLPAGQVLTIPNVLGDIIPADAVLPDSELIYSPSAAAFQVEDYASKAGGFLSSYGEEIDKEWYSGPDIVRRVALETSVNPILLLALLEFRAGWVFGQPASQKRIDFPIGFEAPGSRGLYKELLLTAKELNKGYYGWREGTTLELIFPGGFTARLSPELNAGTVAVQKLLSLFYRPEGWLEALYGSQGFTALHSWMFGDPWARAATVEPLFASGLSAPALELPFLAGERWSLTAGPHISWAAGTPRGALDFAPVTGEPPCVTSRTWATASAPGLVVRSDHGALALDLDGDGYEQTGWVLLYMHLADYERAPVGASVNTDEPLGHPSCEGGTATGTHVHLARKYNGEWIPATGAFPFLLSGWLAQMGERPYDGWLVKGDQVVSARPDGSHQSSIFR